VSNQQSSARHEILETLQASSREYARKATQLSNLLVDAEQFVREMPGKIEVHTEVERGEACLSFEKSKNDWALILRLEGYDERPVRVSQANIQQKAEAAKQLPALYGLLLHHFSSMQIQVDRGLDALKELPFLDFDATQEIRDTDSANDVMEGDSDEIPF
jgi:hypothetical protein